MTIKYSGELIRFANLGDINGHLDAYEEAVIQPSLIVAVLRGASS